MKERTFIFFIGRTHTCRAHLHNRRGQSETARNAIPLNLSPPAAMSTKINCTINQVVIQGQATKVSLPTTNAR